MSYSTEPRELGGITPLWVFSEVSHYCHSLLAFVIQIYSLNPKGLGAFLSFQAHYADQN